MQIFKEIIKLLVHTSELDSKITELQSKMEVVSGLVEKLVRENARTPQDQIEYGRKYEDFKKQYDAAKDALDKALGDKSHKQAQEIKMKAYLQEMKEADDYLTTWSDDVWMKMVESGIVNRNETITFKFTGGKEITL